MNPRAGTAQRLFAEARALATPLLTYWGATVIGLALFSALIVVFYMGGEVAATWAVLGSLWLTVGFGVLTGQLAALLRLRSVWVIALATASWAAASFVGAYVGGMTGAGPIIIFVIIFLFFAPIYFACGHWSLTTNMGLPALFGPLVWFVGDVIVIAERTGGTAEWDAGDKHGVWNVFNAAVLGVGILLCVLYLASREMHRLHRWRFAPVAAEMSASAPEKGLKRGGAAIGCSGLVVLVVLGVVLTGTTALVAPYLWRTGEQDDGALHDDEPQPDPGTDPSGQPQPQPGEPQPAPGPGQQVQRAAQQAAGAMLNLLVILLLTLASIVVFGPPFRRMLLLRHLRRPFWPVPPTRRVAQHWRLVEIALGDLGEPRVAGDSARSLVDRAVQRFGFVDPESLHRCADVADRVHYGLGLRPDDAMMARRTAEMTFQTVWDELGEWQKIRAMYRWL